MEITIAVLRKGKPMTNGEAVNWLINISADIGKAKHSDLWHYEQVLSEIREMLETAQQEIIQCRDCKHSNDKPIGGDRYWCTIHDSYMMYCSDGERKNDE